MLMTKKRGQLSYEYVIIAGTLLFVLIPFFYFFFDVMHIQLNNYYGGVAVNTVADLTKTASNLFRGSTVEAVVRLPKNLKSINAVGGRVITMEYADNNDVDAIGGGYSLFGPSSLDGGPRTVRVTNIVDGLLTISFGGPVIACLTIKDRSINKKDCINQIERRDMLDIHPSDELVIVGSGMSGNTLVHLEKMSQGQWTSDDNPNDNAFVYSVSQDEAPIAETIVYEEPTYGSGDWRVAVEESGHLSNYLEFKIGGKGK